MSFSPSLTAKVDQLLQELPISTALQLPNQQRLGAPLESAKIKLFAKNFKALHHLLNSQIGHIASDYAEGTLDISGNMRDVMSAATVLQQITGNGNPITPSKTYWLQHLKSLVSHSPKRSLQQIQYHYDVSDEFYALWLDPRRTYSCAYYADNEMALAQAQEEKLDLICRKLNLKTGERFLDIGAGWGSLIFWAAENYDVQATGITLSKNQHQYMLEQIEKRGLQNRVKALLCDYRELKDEPFDKIASVGMFEHVGRAHMKRYFTVARKLLKPGGLMLNHGITSGGTNNHQVGQGMGDFIGNHIFPGGELIHISDALQAITSSALETLDVENLRPHYAKTLWAWSDALEAQLDRAYELASDKTVRAYRVYLAGCAMSFEQGWVSIYQILASHPDRSFIIDDDVTGLRGRQSEYPFNRKYMYIDS